MSIFRTKPESEMSALIASIELAPQALQKKDWGHIAYANAWKKQKELVTLRQKNLITDTIVFCEHDPVITLGRASQRDTQSLPSNIPVVEVERGGYATYHGPGQLVGYPILKLSPKNESRFPDGLKQYLCKMEAGIINFLKEFGIEALRIEGQTGVWLNENKKIASIGVAVSHWVTYHGFALNVNTDPSAWQGFNPCGFNPNVMTSMQSELGRDDLKLDELKTPLFAALKKEFK